MNRGVVCKGKISDSDQSLANGVITNWRGSLVSVGDAGLANYVGDAKTFRNLNELNIAKDKWNIPVARGPATIGSFWLGPSAGKGFDKASVPETTIITAMGDDSVSGSNRLSCVAFKVIDRHSGSPDIDDQVYAVGLDTACGYALAEDELVAIVDWLDWIVL
jgi:hypothetical protein